ncbi:MAG: hypothetical protein EHM58_00175 [Ignavibacteriae bacterium]|nr:MAG: hypothetical protein EHM58_00175 [Ignavibacteriota bacterium]
MKKGKIKLTGKIELLSPLRIGSGEDNNTDIDILKDSSGKPFIPATSFIGVLRHYFINFNDADEKEKEELTKFWGYHKIQGVNTKSTSIQSSIKCSDLFVIDEIAVPVDELTSVREGVKIDIKTGMTVKEAKFDFEIAERGIKFDLNMIVDYKEENYKFLLKLMNTIKSELEAGNISIGSKTTSGLGKIKLIDPFLEVYDFSIKNDVIKWLKNENGKGITKDYNEKFNLNTNMFSIDAWFKVKTSLIVKSYPSDPTMPDAIHIQSCGKDVLPGTSLRGAIRSRAIKILNTKFNGKSEKIIDNLFGFVKEGKQYDKDGKEKDNSAKSRIIIEENLIDNCQAEIQTRIKIDRFTGGTIKGALMESMPLFNEEGTEKEKSIRVSIKISNYKRDKAYEAGLMLLILKDLWTGDLPIGGEKNIGRGVLEGIEATISDGIKEIIINKKLDLEKEDINYLQSLLDALNVYKEE